MSHRRIEVLQRPVGRGWIQATLHHAEPPRASLLVVPPFFHEWQRSYRLFALLADALASRGVVVLRFDYRGCGESSGDDADFLPSRALDDADAALRLLRERCSAPPTLLGIRGGALIAERMAEQHRLPWWAWQPAEDGKDHLESLRNLDRKERNNRNRFPFLRHTQAEASGELMGHRVHPEFHLELGIFRRASVPAWRIDTAEACEGSDLVLPPEFSAWPGQIDLQGALPLAAINNAAERLAERLVAICGESA